MVNVKHAYASPSPHRGNINSKGNAQAITVHSPSITSSSSSDLDMEMEIQHMHMDSSNIKTRTPDLSPPAPAPAPAPSSSGDLFHFDPAQMTSIIRRRAMLKELASCYQAECLSYCQDLIEHQGKWEQDLCTSSVGIEVVGSPQMQEIGNPKSTVENEIHMEIVHMPSQKIKHMPCTVSVSNEDASADVKENSTGASKAPLRRHLSWRANEREALRRGLLMFGLGRSDKVRCVMHNILKQMRHGLGDIADCCWEFLRICGLHAEEKERAYAEKLYENSKDLGIEVGAEISSRVGPWDRVEKSASAWLRRFMLLDSLGNVIRLCASKETQEAAYNVIDNLKDGSPFEWWGREADLALLAGVYKHGFGNYEALQNDPQFVNAFRPPLQRENNKKFVDNMQQSPDFEDLHYKERFHMENDPEILGMREGEKFSWPDANTLTRRLRRLVEHINRIEKESDTMAKNIKDKPARGWTKREKMELVKVLMTWGCPLETEDGTNGYWQFVINQASIGPLKNRDESSIENCIKSIRTEMQQALENIQDKEHTSAEPASTLIGPKVLSSKTAVRLKERLELIDNLKQAMDLLPEDWGHLRVMLSQRNNMPPWWQAGHHDREFVKGVLEHGFGNWEVIFGNDSNFNFGGASSISESASHPHSKDCLKRLRFIGCNLRRHLRKLKTRRKRHFVEENENEAEPRRYKRTRHIEIPRSPDGRPILPLPVTDRLTVLDLGTIEYQRPGFHTDRHVFPIGYKSLRNYNSMVDKDGRTTYTCTVVDGGSAGPVFRVIPEESPETIIEKDSASGAWAVVCSATHKIRGSENRKITISGTEMFGLSNPVVIQLIRELPGSEYCSTFFPDHPNIGYQPQLRRQSVGATVIPSIQDDSELRETEVKRKSTASFADQSEHSTSDSSGETDSSDSSGEEEDSDKMAEEQAQARRNLSGHPVHRERTYLDINADPEELESP